MAVAFRSYLIKAIIFNNIEDVRDEITPENVNYIDKKGNSALMFAAISAPDIVKILLDNGARINHQNNEGETCLMHTVWDRLENTKLLLKYGADVNIRDKYGNTALIHAVKMTKNKYIIKDLLQYGSCADVKDYDNNSVLIWASRRINDSEIIQDIIDAGANVNDNNGTDNMYCPLICACINGNYNTVKCLIQNNVKITEDIIIDVDKRISYRNSEGMNTDIYESIVDLLKTSLKNN